MTTKTLYLEGYLIEFTPQKNDKKDNKKKQITSIYSRHAITKCITLYVYMSQGDDDGGKTKLCEITQPNKYVCS